MFGANLKLLAGFGVVVLLLLAVCAGLYWRSEAAVAGRDAAQAELRRTVLVNQKNAKALRELQADRQKERELTRKEIADTQSRASAMDQIKKDMDNVEGANAPAGPYWDAFSERLRGAKRNH